MTFVETLGIVAVTNLLTFGVAVWNFRIKLERRLVALETSVKYIEDSLRNKL